MPEASPPRRAAAVERPRHPQAAAARPRVWVPPPRPRGVPTTHPPACSTAAAAAIAEAGPVNTGASRPGRKIDKEPHMLRAGSQKGIAARSRRLERAAQEVGARRLAGLRRARRSCSARPFGTSKLTQADQYNGQSGKAEKTLEQRFPTPAHESALIHSSTAQVTDPAFRAAIRDIRARVAAIPVVTNIRAATDRRRRGPRLEGRALGARAVRHQRRLDHRRRSHRAGGSRHPRRPAGASRAAHRGVRRCQRRQPDRQVRAERPQAGRDALAARDPAHPGHRVRRARRRRRARAARHLGRDRDHRPGRDPEPHLPRSTTTPRS